MEITFLGTGSPMSPERCATGLLITAPKCEPLLIDTCGGFELPRQLARIGQANRRAAQCDRHAQASLSLQVLHRAFIGNDSNGSKAGVRMLPSPRSKYLRKRTESP